MKYASIEEYYEAHARDKWGWGGETLPKFAVRAKKQTTKLRRSIPIHSYVGANGGGKSLAMVNDTLPTLNGIKWECHNPNHYHFQRWGQTTGYRRVLSTVKLVDPRTGEPHPLFIPYADHRLLLILEHADVLMDEITGVASAYEASAMPTQVTNILMQLRRRDVTLRWTTPNWAAAAKRIREVTKGVTFCKGYLPQYQQGRTWSSKTLFLWKTYDAGNFENFNVGTQNRILPETFEWYLRSKLRNQASEAYDTLEDVLAISSHDSHGMCVHCGGKKAIPRCVCAAELDTTENFWAVADTLVNPDDYQRIDGFKQEERSGPHGFAVAEHPKPSAFRFAESDTALPGLDSTAHTLL